MAMPIIELEGTWAEIQGRLPDFKGKWLRVTVQVEDSTSNEHTSTLDEALTQIWTSVPDASWHSLPKVMASNMDHYLYGAPKHS